MCVLGYVYARRGTEEGVVIRAKESVYSTSTPNLLDPNSHSHQLYHAYPNLRGGGRGVTAERGRRGHDHIKCGGDFEVRTRCVPLSEKEVERVSDKRGQDMKPRREMKRGYVEMR